MNETEARAWVCRQYGVPRETQLARFVDILTDEASRQNLVAPSTLPVVWLRHIVDSAQLLTLAGDRGGLWIDIGSGAGLPGIVIAILRPQPILLVEPRRKRVEFLERLRSDLSLSNVEIARSRIEQVPATARASIISARAVASLPDLFAGAIHLADPHTTWLLPKGRSAESEVAIARATWQGVFHVEPSLTEPDSRIVVATEISAR